MTEDELNQRGTEWMSAGKTGLWQVPRLVGLPSPCSTAATAMKLSVFASHWGTQGFFKGRTRKWLEGVKEEGFAGVEMSLNDLGGDDVERKATCKAIADHGLRLILGLYSGWVDYEGPWEAATPDAHLATLEKQFDAAAALPTATLAHVNVHAGCDSWAEDVAGPFLSRSLGLGAQFLEAHPHVGAGVRSKDGLGGDPKHLQGVSFETHRGRCLFAPFGTMRYLDYIEPLRLTADLSHWHLVSERLFDDAPSFARLRDEVAPCVDHLHARIGSTQQSQLAPEARYWTADAHVPPFGDHAPHKVAAVAAHEKFWAAVWRHHRDRGAAEVLATPEYGPPPYQTKAPSKIDPNVEKHLWLQTCDAKNHLESVFADVMDE